MEDILVGVIEIQCTEVLFTISSFLSAVVVQQL